MHLAAVTACLLLPTFSYQPEAGQDATCPPTLMENGICTNRDWGDIRGLESPALLSHLNLCTNVITEAIIVIHAWQSCGTSLKWR